MKRRGGLVEGHHWRMPKRALANPTRHQSPVNVFPVVHGIDTPDGHVLKCRHGVSNTILQDDRYLGPKFSETAYCDIPTLACNRPPRRLVETSQE